MNMQSNSTISVENLEQEQQRNRTVELALIGGCLRNPQWVNPLTENILADSDFICNDTKQLFIAMKKHVKNFPKFDPITLSASMIKDNTWKNEFGAVLGYAMTSDGKPANAVKYALILRERSLHLQMKEACRNHQFDDILPLAQQLTKIDEMKSGNHTPDNICFSEPPQPLLREEPPSQDFPLEALGETLQNAAEGIAMLVAGSSGIAAAEVLASAALAAQGVGYVQNLFGERSPLNEFFLILAGTGDRKTAVENLALRSHREFSKQQIKSFKSRQASALADEFVPKGASLTGDPTLEGLIVELMNTPSVGVFKSEASFFHGFSFGKEQALKTITELSGLWDAVGGISRRRAKEDTTLFGRRVSIGVMAQREMVPMLNDKIIGAQGIFNRFLINNPKSEPVGKIIRLSLEERKRLKGDLLQPFYNNITTMLEAQKYEADGELQLRKLQLSDEAFILADRFLSDLGPKMEGEYDEAIGLAKKSVEHIMRLAGITMLADYPEATVIDAQHMTGAIRIMEYYMGEALRLKNSAHGDREEEKLENCDKLRLWLVEGKGKRFVTDGVFNLVHIYMNTPSYSRGKKPTLKLLDELKDHGYVEQVDPSDHKKRSLWRIRDVQNQNGMPQQYLGMPIGGSRREQYDEEQKRAKQYVHTLNTGDDDALPANYPPPQPVNDDKSSDFAEQSITNNAVTLSNNEPRPDHEVQDENTAENPDDIDSSQIVDNPNNLDEVTLPDESDSSDGGDAYRNEFDNSQTVDKTVGVQLIDNGLFDDGIISAPQDAGYSLDDTHQPDGEYAENTDSSQVLDNVLQETATDGDSFDGNASGNELNNSQVVDNSGNPDDSFYDDTDDDINDNLTFNDNVPPLPPTDLVYYRRSLNTLDVTDLKRMAKQSNIFLGKPEAATKVELVNRLVDAERLNGDSSFDKTRQIACYESEVLNKLTDEELKTVCSEQEIAYPEFCSKSDLISLIVGKDTNEQPLSLNEDEGDDSIVVLKARCGLNGLSVTGSKDTLIKRLELIDQESANKSLSVSKYTWGGLAKLTYEEVFKVCEQHGLPISGTKKDGIARILVWQKNTESVTPVVVGDVKEVTLKILQGRCREKHLPVTGNKKALIQRLSDFEEAKNGGKEATPQYTRSGLNRLKKNDLIAICDQHSLATSNNKMQMVANILAWQNGNGRLASNSEYDQRRQKLDFLKIPDLVKMCKKKSLKVSGNKNDLITRLMGGVTT